MALIIEKFLSNMLTVLIKAVILVNGWPRAVAVLQPRLDAFYCC